MTAATVLLAAAAIGFLYWSLTGWVERRVKIDRIWKEWE
jgi:hypothetical protein